MTKPANFDFLRFCQKFLSKFFYQKMTVTQIFISTSIFSSFVVPAPGMGVSTQISECLQRMALAMGFSTGNFVAKQEDR